MDEHYARAAVRFTNDVPRTVYTIHVISVYIGPKLEHVFVFSNVIIHL